MMKKFYFVLLLSCIFVFCNGNPSCVLKETCSACIRTSGCVWCSLPVEGLSKESESLVRCMNADQQPQGWCPPQHIVDLKSSIYLLENKDLSAGSDTEEAVQIKPQRLKLALRQGEQILIPFEYQQAKSYPVDLYYLMDLSASMADDRDELSALGSKLAIVMNNITNNFKLGFGSFVDKPEMPFVSTVPEKLKKPCELPSKQPCAPPYAFKNQMPLTTKTDSFSTEVKNAPVSGNMDYPEGGFDALMQAMVCTKEIGWRPKARKLLIFSTDAGYHLAGDGKLAGIVEPNDELCHLDEKGTYTHSLRTDYPSITQLDKKARENNINIIFAITKSQGETYKMLKDNIHGAAYGTLTKDSSNIVDLVKAEYDKLVDSITITDNSGGSVEIQYFSKCLGTEEKQRNECGGLRGRPKVFFGAMVKAVSCPEDREKWNQVINIKPGSLNESLTIELEIICECPCEKPNHTDFEGHSKHCNSSGSLKCGVCSCDPGRYGRFCECSGDEAKIMSGDTSHCRPDNTTDIICSGLGFCKCGKCDCVKRSNPEEVIYGTYCECDNFSCKRNGGLLCSGPDKGRCECGQCTCQSGWSGTACECRETNTTCIAPNSEEVCSGHGICFCGVCQCKMTDEFRYSGRYCEECPHCAGTRCNELLPCVECQIHGTGLYDESECKIKCTSFQSETVEAINTTINTENNMELVCSLPDSTGCTVVFKYKYEDDNISLKVFALKNKQCPIQMWVVIVGGVFSIVLPGLILLIIWKILTSLHDKREYVRFERERQMAKWDRGDNPLYKPSTTTFSNPTFRSQ